jgi:acetyl-CoA carboxylase beta subunit
MSCVPLGFRDTKRYTDRLKEARDAHGIVDMMVARADLPETLGRIIGLLPPSPLPALAAPAPEPAEPAGA